ncbi:MAG: hypothetical protein AAGD12_08330 [Pseudomonadota bacterium]
MTPVYIAPEIAEMMALHPYVQDLAFLGMPVRDQVAQQAATLQAAHSAGDPRVRVQIMSWWPAAAGKTLDWVMSAVFDDADARVTLSREYGFSDWDAVTALGALAPDARFERALETMLAGELETLVTLLGETPDLVRQRSAFGHGATLLHYLGANGVETHRQRVPLNAVEIAAALIAAGASKTAEARMYGGGQTPLSLARTSAHPLKAGLADALIQALSID